MENKKNKIYKLTCPICKKKIVSLSENQADYNMKAHRLTHKLPKSNNMQKEIKEELSGRDTQQS